MSDNISLVWDGQAYVCTPVTETPPPQEQEVIAYSQNDPQWANQEYASGFTFARYGCLVTCIAMITATHLREDHNPLVTAEKLRNANAFVGGMLGRPSQIPVAIPSLTWQGVQHWRTVPADIAQLANMVNQHGPTTIEVKWNPYGESPEKGNQHFVLATRVIGDNVEIVDAWDGKTYMITETRYAKPRNWSASRAIHGVRMVWPK